MSYGVILRDLSGRVVYDSSGELGASVLVLDSFSVLAGSSGSKQYTNPLGGSFANMGFIALPRDYRVRPMQITISGGLLSWSPVGAGGNGIIDIVVTIK